jgi:hypothetical protein
MELISGAQGPGVTPRATAVAALIYTAYTLTGMALFGIEPWVSRAETFSVYFGMFSELSPFEVRDSRLGIRRPLAGASGWARVPGSIAVVVATIAGTAFDGPKTGSFSSRSPRSLSVSSALALRLRPLPRSPRPCSSHSRLPWWQGSTGPACAE